MNGLREEIKELMYDLWPMESSSYMEATIDDILDVIIEALPNPTHPTSGNFLNFGRTLWIDYKQVLEIISSAKSQQENNKEKS